jgi:hypothetical protein
VSKQYNGQLVADMARLSKPFGSEDNDRLYPLVAAGDATARQQMIEGNMSLAVAKVESFIRCYPGAAHLRDDLTRAAFIGLTKAANHMAEGCRIKEPDNWTPTDCIGAWINRELSELVESETTIRLPARSKYRAQAKGRKLKVPGVRHEIPERFEVPSYQKQLEDRDLLESCCCCKEERTLLAMWVAGHTNAEIAKALGKSAESTRRLGKRLQARIRRKVDALRDE